MNKFVSVMKVAGVIAGVVVVGIALGWLGSRKPAGTTQPNQPAETATPAPTAAVNAKPSASPTAAAQPVPAQSEIPASPAALEKPLTATTPETNWEGRIDEILISKGAAPDKAKQMLEMFPRLPEEGQTEVAKHLSNLLPDSDYPALGKYLTNSATAPSVLEVMYAGLLNRPNSLKLPLLLNIARDEQNPKAGDATGMLKLFLEEDFGKDWGRWQTRMEQWLKDNPD